MSILAIAGLVALLALVGVAAWYAAQAVTRSRIRTLLDAANRVRGGDLSVRLRVAPGKDELSQLGAAFDEMAHALQNRDTELREAVLELHTQASTDPLTRLSNRRQLTERLPREVIRAQHRNGRVAALMIDIDFFKKINDTYGHNAGDLVLREVGQVLRAGVRASDLACRYGGEEIAVILPDTSLKVATERAESIRHSISALRLTHEGRELAPVTVSIGLAIFPDHAADAEGLLRVADEALYRAKRGGRDRVSIGLRPDPATA